MNMLSMLDLFRHWVGIQQTFRVLCGVFICAVCSIVFAQNSLNPVGNTMVSEFAVDDLAEGKNITDVLSLNWRPMTSNHLGNQTRPVWIRVHIQTEHPNSKKVVRVANRRLKSVRAVQVEVPLDVSQPQIFYELGTSGLEFPFNARSIRDREFVYQLTTDALGRLELLFRVEAQRSMIFPVYVMEPLEYAEHSFQVALFDGVFIGLLLALMLFNLITYAVNGDGLWLSYSGYALVAGFTALVPSGIPEQYFWPRHPEWNEFWSHYLMAIALPILQWVLFSFLKAEGSKWMDRRYLLSMAPVLLGSWVCFLFADEWHWFNYGLLVVWFVSVAFYLYKGISLQHPIAKPFLVSWLFLIGGYLPFMALQVGLLDYMPWLEWTTRIGLGAQLLILAVVVGGRFNQVNELRQRAVSAKLELEQSVSKLKDLNAQMNEYEKQLLKDRAIAEDASKTKSEFLALMSHELRTPMAGVIGILGLVLREQIGPSVREKISLAQKNASSLLAIVNDLLDVSKIEAGKFKLEIMDFELLLTLEDALSLQSERARQKSIFLNLEVDSSLPHYLVGDPTRLRQVLINLVGNAIKFTDSGGITVRVSSLSVDSVSNTAQLHFEVIDTGIGMKPEALGRMFQKFEQADTSTSRKFGGTGLGLAICKQLVELMGGTIGVTSTLGSGSTFWFKLSLPIGQKPPQEQAVEIKRHVRSLSVLVAEDAQTNQIIIRSIIEEMGHQVTVVDHGQLAVKALSEQNFDVVLMDGRMPIMDGLEASRHIRLGQWSDENGQLWQVKNPEVHIIALTANASEQDRAQFMAAGMNKFLTKPVQEPLLFEALQRVIDEMPDLTSLDALLAPLPEELASKSTPNLVVEVASPPLKSSLQEKMWLAFKEQAPLNLNEIDQAIAQDDWNTVAIKVHGIKGSVSYIWPESDVYHVAAKLEKHADAKEIQAFNSGFVQLKTQLQELLS